MSGWRHGVNIAINILLKFTKIGLQTYFKTLLDDVQQLLHFQFRFRLIFFPFCSSFEIICDCNVAKLVAY